MVRGFETGSDNERIDELQKQLDDVLDSQISSVGGNEDISIDSSRGSRNAASGDSGGVRSNEPITHQITDVDEGGTPTGVFDKINLVSSMIIVDFSTPAVDIELRFIQGTAKDGAKIKITPKVGRTLIIKSGGNILTSADITVTDTEFYELIKHSEAETGVTGGAYKIILTGSGGGDVSQWATFPAVADINFATFDGINIDRLRLVSDSNAPVSSGDPSIFLDVAGFMNLNVASNDGIRLKSNDVEIARFQSSTQIGLIMGTSADIRLEGNELFLDTTDTTFIDANTPNSLRLTTNSTVALTIGSASIIPSRDIVFSNILSNVLKMSGKEIFLDADNDTIIDSVTDDSLRFTVGGSPRLIITNTAILPTSDISFTNALSNVLRMQGKDIFLDADNDTSIDSVNDDSIRFITGGSPRLTISNTAILPTSDISFTNALTHVLKMNGKAIFLDTDNDSSISSVSDDSIQIATGGSTQLSISNGFVTVANTLLINGNIFLGDSSADNITFNGDTVGNITANVDNTDNIGNLARTYAFGFFKGGVGIVEGYLTGFKPTGQTDTGIIFTVPTAGGKTQLRCSFQTGGSVLIVEEP